MNHDFDILTDAEIDQIAEHLDERFRPRLPGKLGKLVAQALETADGPVLRSVLRTIAKTKRRHAGRPANPEKVPEQAAAKPARTRPAWLAEEMVIELVADTDPPAVETPE